MPSSSPSTSNVQKAMASHYCGRRSADQWLPDRFPHSVGPPLACRSTRPPERQRVPSASMWRLTCLSLRMRMLHGPTSARARSSSSVSPPTASAPPVLALSCHRAKSTGAIERGGSPGVSQEQIRRGVLHMHPAPVRGMRRIRCCSSTTTGIQWAHVKCAHASVPALSTTLNDDPPSGSTVIPAPVSVPSPAPHAEMRMTSGVTKNYNPDDVTFYPIHNHPREMRKLRATKDITILEKREPPGCHTNRRNTGTKFRFKTISQIESSLCVIPCNGVVKIALNGRMVFDHHHLPRCTPFQKSVSESAFVRPDSISSSRRLASSKTSASVPEAKGKGRLPRSASTRCRRSAFGNRKAVLSISASVGMGKRCLQHDGTSRRRRQPFSCYPWPL